MYIYTAKNDIYIYVGLIRKRYMLNAERKHIIIRICHIIIRICHIIIRKRYTLNAERKHIFFHPDRLSVCLSVRLSVCLSVVRAPTF